MWTILLWILLFIGSYLIIFYCVDIFLDNLKALSVVYGLSGFIMGSLIVGGGIDFEELLASTVGSINGLPYIAIGNVIGNSIIALTLCFALPAIFYKFSFKPVSHFFFLIIFASFFLIVLGFFLPFGLLVAGIGTLGLYGIFLIRNLKYSHETETEGLNEADKKEIAEKSKRKMILLVIISILVIIFAAQLMIMAAEEIIELTGLSESFFGFVIIAFVTNVEELTLMIKAIKKKAVEVGLGGMLGKLVWNLTIVFGISGVILMNIVIIPTLIWNSLILLSVLIVIYLIARKGSMNKKDGLLLAGLFITFLVLNFLWL